MAALRSPKVQSAMKEVMEKGPEAFKNYADDPELMELLGKLSGRMQ